MTMAVKHEFVVWGNPRGKGRPRFTMRGHTYTDAVTTEYEGKVKRAWKQENFYKLEKQPTTVIITAYFPVPVSLSKKKRAALFGTQYLGKPDGDNIGKIILDSLNSLAYSDDSQIDTLLVTKLYVKDGEEPRVKVTIIGEGDAGKDG